MADKKRKTLQIKRPNPNPPGSKKKPLPNVKMDEKSATSSINADESTASQVPKTAKTDPQGGNASTTRIALPDEDKIRRARRANATQDLEEEGAMPSAAQIEQAQKNATMPIMIDTESIEESSSQKLPTGDTDSDLDRTMEIDPEALSTGNLETQLVEDTSEETGDQTMKIDPKALETRNVESELNAADNTEETGDQTMEIDPEALQTQNMSDDLSSSDAPAESGDKTMAIDPEALQTGPVEGVEDVQAMETMKMETMKMDEELDTELTKEEMEESFNAQTMAVDSDQLEEELSNKAEDSKSETKDPDSSKTMDLSNKGRPKTIMIKRPSRDGGTSSAPTVKASRPDAATIKASRPVTANRGEAKESTSRIDVPGESGQEEKKEGKTIKLRRPTGAPSTASSTASRAGLDINAIPDQEQPLGAGWLAVAILTFLVSLGAIWTLVATSQPELPMPGRLVDVNQQLIQR